MTHVRIQERRAIPAARASGDAVLNAPLLQLSPTDHFTARDAFQNIFCYGGTGSGKTSGSGAALRDAYLLAGYGGLVLAAKPDEIEQWIAAARACGREHSLIVFGENDQFNFLEHEIARQGLDGIGSVVEYLMGLVEANRLAMPNAGRVGEAFFEDTQRQLLRNTIPVIFSATGTVQIEDILAFVGAAPTNTEQLGDPEWRERSPMYQAMAKAWRDPVAPLPEGAMKRILAYWHDVYARLDPKTRANVTISLSTALDRFMHGRLNRVFCRGTTVVPELAFQGAIILLNMPSLVWNEDGIIGQNVWKMSFQRAVLGRNSLPEVHRTRPVFLWMDEAQNFLNLSDPPFLSMSRSSRCSTVCLTQSLPAIYAKIGGENAKHSADMLLANFGTKIFHNNSCPETNRFAAETIGRAIQRRATYSENESDGVSYGMNTGESWNSGSNTSFGSSTDSRGQGSSSTNFGSSSGYSDSTGRQRGRNSGYAVSTGYSENMDWEIEPAEFSRSLKTGGPANGGIVSGIWFQAGRRFAVTQRTWLPVSFRQ